MTFQEVKTPEQLMMYLDQSFEYGVIDHNGNRFFDSSSIEFQQVCKEQWELRLVKEMLKDGVGHCYDQVEIEREWFAKNGYEVKTFWISAYQEGIENSGFSHAYLVYKEKNTWKLFEHADFANKGIHEFDSIKNAVQWQAKRQIEFAQNCEQPITEYVTCIKQFSTPPTNITMKEYLNFIDHCEDYMI